MFQLQNMNTWFLIFQLTEKKYLTHLIYSIQEEFFKKVHKPQRKEWQEKNKTETQGGGPFWMSIEGVKNTFEQ